MKRNLIKILMVIICVSALAFCFSACKKESTHNLNLYVDGEVYQTVSVVKDGQVQMPKAPEKKGYVFVGWFLDNGAFEKPFKVSSIKGGMEKDLNVYAKFESVFRFSDGVIDGLTSYAKENLTEINVPNSINGKLVKEISEDAFVSASKVESIYLPNTIENIEAGTFSGCKNLTTLEMEDGNSTYHTFGNCIIETNKLTVVAGCKGSTIPVYALSIEEKAFYDTGIISISIPKNVDIIKESAFEKCSELTTLTFEEDSCLKIISEDAFADCVKLDGVVLPEGLKTVGNGAFYGCKSLSTITVSSTVIIIGDYAFQNCEKLATVNFGEESMVNTIGQGAFTGCIELTSFNLPKDVNYIKIDTFKDCVKLKTITFNQNSILNTIDSYAFNNCTSLESIILPVMLRTISNNAFEDCVALSTIEFNGNMSLLSSASFGKDWNLNVPVTEIKCSDANYPLTK